MTPCHGLLLAVLRAGISGTRSVAPEPLDAPLSRSIAALAVDTRLAFPVLRCVQESDAFLTVPSESVKQLVSQVRESVARNASHRFHAQHILEGCALRGIPVMLVKGLWLAEQVYREPGARDACDIDLLVRPADLGAFTDLAVDLGFQLPAAGAQLHSYSDRTNEILLVHPSGVQLDVHWGITHPLAEQPVDEESLWRRAEIVDIAGTRGLTLNLEDHLLYLCFHAAVHHQFWAIGPRFLLDVAMVLRQPPREIRWDEFVGRARDLGWERSAWLVFALVREHLGAAPPSAVMQDLHPGGPDDAGICRSALEAIFGAQERLGPYRQLAILLATPTWRQRMAAVRQLLLPTRVQMTNQFGTDAPLWRLHLWRWCTKARALAGTFWMLLRSSFHRAELGHTKRIQAWLMPQTRRRWHWIGSQVRVGLVTVLVLPVFAVLVRCMTLPRLLARIEGTTAAAELRPAVEEAAALGRAVNMAAARGPWPVKCLTRSLVLHWLLRRRQIASVLRLGVASADGFRAHAWVECGNVPVNDRPDVASVFAPFESLSFERRQFGS